MTNAQRGSSYWRRLALAAFSVVFLRCSGSSQPPAAATATATAEGLDDTRAIARTLSILARAQDLSEDELARVSSSIEDGTFDYPSFIDLQLRDPRFAEVVASDVLLAAAFAEPLFHLLSGGMLSKSPIGGAPTYYLGEPCEPDEVVTVSPWWNLKSTVRVCASSYAPTVFRDSKTGQACSGSNWEERPDSSSCGCGPNLMRCWRDSEHRLAARESMKDEVRNTLGGIVAADRPLRDLYTSNATIRDTTADLLYQRWQVELGMQDELTAVETTAPLLRQRVDISPGLHAGILTTHMMLWRRDSRRSRMDTAQEDMWCVESTSIGVDAKRIQDFMHATTTSDVRYGDDAWKDLAQRDFCTTCHARMDYGWQFFKGFQRPVISRHYQPEEATTKGTLPVYFANISDSRGEVTATPRGYAEFAVAQPEFGACMTKHVAAYVLGQPSEYERQALLASFERKGDLRSLMKRALELYVEREQRARSKKHVPASSALPPPSSVAATELVTLRPESVELLDDHCLALCHTTGLFGRPPEDHTLSRAEVAWTLAYVSNELMPLRMSLAKEPREKLILSLIDDAWHNNQRLADAARTRFLGPLRAPTAHNTELFLPNLPENSTNRIERFLIPSQTVGASIRRVSPGTAALLYAHATSRCVTRLRAQTGRAPSKQDIQACLETTIDPAVLSH